MDIPWDDVRLFLAIADGGSLSAAARRLRVAQPTVSRRLAELESLLGEPLFVRGVEGATPTSFGERLLEPARRMAEWAGDVERVAQHTQTTPRGVVRITAPPGVAFDFLAPFAAWAKSKLPEVRFEVVSTVHFLDLARREADLAVRTQQPRQRDLVTVASFEHEGAAFATREYIARLRPGYGVADVDWIGWAPPLEHMSPNPELAALVPGFQPVFASDDFLVQLRAAEAGLGAIFLGRLTHRFARPTTLEELDLDVGPLLSAWHVVCARTALDVPRIRAVAELLRAELERIERRPPKRPPPRRS